jgi:hypothetical protein
MAKTVLEAFKTLRANLEITGLQESTVSTRQTQVRSALEDGLTVLDSFLIGSYRRSTLISPLTTADIDIFVVLDPSYFKKHTPKSLLETVRDVLRKRYPSTPKITPDGQAVSITFTDFVVDVVPSFNRQGGGYLIGDANAGVWISTDPTKHYDVLANANKTHDGDLVPLAKMIKGWNRSAGNPLIPFYLEMMTDEVLRGVKISNFPSGVRFVLDKGRERVKKKIIDPAGYGNQINSLKEAKSVEAAVAKVTTAHAAAVNAEQFDAAGKPQAAIAEWKKVFGDYFPAYG